MPAPEFLVEASTAALERRTAISALIPPGATGNDFAAKEGQPGNVVIITGANKVRPYMGIGAATGIELARRGMDNIVITSTPKPESVEQAHEAAQLMANEGARVVWYGVDHTQKADNYGLVRAIFEKFGRVNYLVGAAGELTVRPALRVKPEEDQTDREVALMLMANYHLTKAIITEAQQTRTLRAFKAGAFAGSVVMDQADGGQPGYAMAKAGLVGLISNFGAEFGKYTRFNIAAFGFIETVMTQRLHESEEGKKFIKKRISVGRIGTPEEAANVLAFLLSDAASFVNRQILVTDGGMSTLTQ